MGALGMGGELNPEFLLKTKEFAGRDPEFVKDVASRSNLALFTEGDIILHQGDSADTLYCLKAGEVAIIVDEVQVATLGSGAVFGIAAMFDKAGIRNATVKASGFCDCRVITRTAFQASVQNFPLERAHFKELAAEQVKLSKANKLMAERKAIKERSRPVALNQPPAAPVSATGIAPWEDEQAYTGGKSKSTSPTPRPMLSLQDEEKRRARVQKVRDQIHARAGLCSVPASLGLVHDLSPRESRNPCKAYASPRTSRRPSKTSLPGISHHGLGRDAASLLALTPRKAITPHPTSISSGLLSERAPKMQPQQNRRSITLPDDLGKLFERSISENSEV